MKYEFDRVIDRRGTASLKYDFGKRRMGREDLLPLWVADMDFSLPEEILDRIRERVGHGIFGYTEADEAYYDSLEGWFARRHRVFFRREWNTVTPSVVYGISTAIEAFTEKGDGVLIQEPVYYPFRETIVSNQRVCVNNQLKLREGHYEIDFEDFEDKIKEHAIRLFILCSPHNPVGRVWKREELERLADICLRHGVKILSDEIHCDFVYPGHEFCSFAALGEPYSEHAVICTSASKSFNLAGLQAANLLIPNAEMRKRFRAVNHARGFSQGNTLGLTATKAVYDLGEEWLEELLGYLKGNLDYIRSFLRDRLPEIHLVEPEGTYLIWLDFSQAVQSEQELQKLVCDEARLWLDDGGMFGSETRLFERINIACPRSILEQAMARLEEAVRKHRA